MNKEEPESDWCGRAAQRAGALPEAAKFPEGGERHDAKSGLDCLICAMKPEARNPNDLYMYKTLKRFELCPLRADALPGRQWYICMYIYIYIYIYICIHIYIYIYAYICIYSSGRVPSQRPRRDRRVSECGTCKTVKARFGIGFHMNVSMCPLFARTAMVVAKRAAAHANNGGIQRRQLDTNKGVPGSEWCDGVAQRAGALPEAPKGPEGQRVWHM